MQNSGILFIFHNPEIPGLKLRQSRDSGLRKWAGIPGSRDSGSRDWNPYCQHNSWAPSAYRFTQFVTNRMMWSAVGRHEMTSCSKLGHSKVTSITFRLSNRPSMNVLWTRKGCALPAVTAAAVCRSAPTVAGMKIIIKCKTICTVFLSYGNYCKIKLQTIYRQQ